jgi:hypothetical protein
MIVRTQCEIVWMVDFLSNLTTIVGLIGSFVVIIGGIAACYVYWSRRRFAVGKRNIRSVGFYPPGVVKNIKLELTDWQQALPGETLPMETVSIADSEDGEYIRLGGLTRVALKRTGNPPAVVLHFVLTNPDIIPASIREIEFTIQRHDGRNKCNFIPAFFGKKDAPNNSRVPAGLPFDEYWGPILIQPTSSSEHRLVFVPKPPDNMFEGFTVGEYECSVELKFERFFRLMKRKEKSRRIKFKFDVDEATVEDWKHDKPVILPYGLLLDV